MGVSSFGDNGELYFEIQLVAVSGEEFFVEALFDTGFTDGWLAINTQDLEALGWSLLLEPNLRLWTITRRRAWLKQEADPSGEILIEW
jgi:predicted aspartyl protease